MHGRPRPRLRPSEWRVLARLARGETNAEIAAALGITTATVSAHVSSIFRALAIGGAGNRRAAAGRWYREHPEEHPEES
jgi:DNA-binding NarL/FixJ family response regulator